MKRFHLMLEAIVQGHAMTCPHTAPSQPWQRSTELSKQKFSWRKLGGGDKDISLADQLCWELPYRKEHCKLYWKNRWHNSFLTSGLYSFSSGSESSFSLDSLFFAKLLSLPLKFSNRAFIIILVTPRNLR